MVIYYLEFLLPHNILTILGIVCLSLHFPLLGWQIIFKIYSYQIKNKSRLTLTISELIIILKLHGKLD